MRFEQGPIRPPSEAASLLVRVSRNCPWNHCAFCPVYKGSKFSLRTVEEVLSDLDAMKEVYGDHPRTVFLQDANPVLTKPDELIQIVEGIRERFPNVRRITAYARSHTLARRTVEDLKRIREAGLDRLHVGLESGCDDVLKMVKKGTTSAEQIKAGLRAKEAGFELSHYVMPGLGGRAHTDAHADDTAAVIKAVGPDFVRLRTTVVIPGTPLAELEEQGIFEPLTEVDLVAEIRRFLDGLRGVQTRVESDHMMNLLMELRGDLPQELDRLIGVCDALLALPEREQMLFIIARRVGWSGTLETFDLDTMGPELEDILDQLETRGIDFETFSTQWRRRMV